MHPKYRQMPTSWNFRVRRLQNFRFEMSYYPRCYYYRLDLYCFDITKQTTDWYCLKNRPRYLHFPLKKHEKNPVKSTFSLFVNWFHEIFQLRWNFPNFRYFFYIPFLNSSTIDRPIRLASTWDVTVSWILFPNVEAGLDGIELETSASVPTDVKKFMSESTVNVDWPMIKGCTFASKVSGLHKVYLATIKSISLFQGFWNCFQYDCKHTNRLSLHLKKKDEGKKKWIAFVIVTISSL